MLGDGQGIMPMPAAAHDAGPLSPHEHLQRAIDVADNTGAAARQMRDLLADHPELDEFLKLAHKLGWFRVY